MTTSEKKPETPARARYAILVCGVLALLLGILFVQRYGDDASVKPRIPTMDSPFQDLVGPKR